MAVVEIREHVIALEPDKCRQCGSLFAGISTGGTGPVWKPFADVTVNYDCGSEDWFGTWYGPTEGVTGIIAIHVGEIDGEAVYIRRVFSQQGDCFARENDVLRESYDLALQRIDALEAEDELSKQRLRLLLREQGFITGAAEETI
jgi:hypothetical protein